MNKLIKAAFVVFSGVFIFISCTKDPNHMITKRWKMENNELILDIRADSSYVVIENNKKPQVGRWTLSEDEKTISFGEKNKDAVPMQIDKLSEAELVIDNNGDDMVFTPEK